MLPFERRDTLVAVVNARGSARVGDLARELGVSAMTIRRDLDELEREGVLVRIHGGVRSAGPGATTGMRLPQPSPPSAGLLVAARRAAAIVEPGMSVGLSAGSASALVARELRTVKDLTFVTTSLPVAAALDSGPSPSQSVVLTGGVRTPAGGLVGPMAVRSLTEVHCDIVFCSVQGIDPRAGFTSPNILEAETTRALINSGLRVVVVATGEAWKQVSLTTIADLDAADVVVLDRLAEDDLAELSAHTGEVVLAGGSMSEAR